MTPAGKDNGMVIEHPYVPVYSLEEANRLAQEQYRKDRLALQNRRRRELRQREKTIAEWRIRDPKMIPKLKEQWKKSDADRRAKERFLTDLICTVCSRPFTSIRPPIKNVIVRCPQCTRAIRLKKHRDDHMRRREHDNARGKAYDQRRKAEGYVRKRPENEFPNYVPPPPIPVRHSTSRPVPSQPVVVWTPD